MLGELDFAVHAEFLAELAAARIDLRHLVIGDTPAAVRPLARAGHAGVVAPALHTRRRVERDHAIERRAVDEVLACSFGQQDRRCLRGNARRLPGRRGHVAVTMGPGRLESRDVGERDVRRRAVVPAVRVAGGLCRADAKAQQHREQRSRCTGITHAAAGSPHRRGTCAGVPGSPRRSFCRARRSRRHRPAPAVHATAFLA